MVSQYLQLFKWQFEEENTLFEYYDLKIINSLVITK